MQIDVTNDLTQSKRLMPRLFRSIFATTLFRCWYLIVLVSAWAACVALINDKVCDLSIQPTLLTAFGTVLGCLISYRTSTAFERYNQGGRLWSTIILASRTLARTVWFHVADDPTTLAPQLKAEESGRDPNITMNRSRTLIEKRTIINLIEAFSIAVKHYLRGEDGIDHEDLYKLVKFLPAYALPDSAGVQNDCDLKEGDERIGENPLVETRRQQSWVSGSTAYPDGPELPHEIRITISDDHDKSQLQSALQACTQARIKPTDGPGKGPVYLLPAENPPKQSIYYIWPFSLLAEASPDRFNSRKAAARQRNIPLEITFYLSSYIAALQHQKLVDVPTTSTLLLGLNQLVESLSGLERILTTPIPFSYGTHLWTSCFLYLIFLPFQIWQSLGYVTIPATAVASFIFIGFLVAGEEIENPFGYDKSDFDMDYFCKNLIRAELDALMSVPVPNPEVWVFSDDNNNIFKNNGVDIPQRSPNDWLKEGDPERAMRDALKAGLKPKTGLQGPGKVDKATDREEIRSEK